MGTLEGNIRKAAIVLMSLPKDDASALLGRMAPKEVEVVTTEIAKLGVVPGAEQEEALREMAESNPNALSSQAGGIQVAKDLLEKTLGKNAAAAIDNIRHSIEAIPFGFLHKLDAQNVLTYLMEEHPQTIALVLAHLPASLASEVIKGLKPAQQVAVIRRIATMDQTSPEIISEVEQALKTRMASVMNQRFESAGGVASVAEILNVVDRTTEKNLLDTLGQDDPELVEEIRRLMFVFDDIVRFTDKDIQTVLKNVETSQWAMALKGASEELREKIFRNMSKRGAKLLQEEMEFLGSVRVSSVEQMQQQIVDVIRLLEDSGELIINAGEEEEAFVQ